MLSDGNPSLREPMLQRDPESEEKFQLSADALRYSLVCDSHIATCSIPAISVPARVLNSMSRLAERTAYWESFEPLNAQALLNN